jgi:hypothetical protein
MSSGLGVVADWPHHRLSGKMVTLIFIQRESWLSRNGLICYLARMFCTIAREVYWFNLRSFRSPLAEFRPSDG